MPLHCDSLSKDVQDKLNQHIVHLPLENAIRRESTDGDITVSIHGDHVVFHSAAGFYFRKVDNNDIEGAIMKEIHTPREYLCSAFEIDNPSLIQKVLDRIQECHGIKYIHMIDNVHITFKGRNVLLVKFPSCVVRQMMAPSGGIMKTGFSGPTESLKKIPTLVKLANIPEGNDYTSSVFVTEYQKGQLDFVNRLHYDLVKEVIARPYAGITLSPLAIWDA